MSPALGLCAFGPSLGDMVAAAAAADRHGFDAVWTSELYNRSATVTLAAFAGATARCRIGSGVMYGVGRSPLMLAAEARDLDELSGGRMVLGLGNGTRRMISDWHGLDGSAPAVRMEELVGLVREIWAVHERPVDHDGRFYRMRFRALEDLVGAPPRAIPIVVAGANPRMVEAAGRVADGVLAHTLCSPKYLQEVVRPALERGARVAGRDPREVRLITYTLACAGEDREQARADAAAMIAFYGSVRSYAPLFAIHGFGPQAEAIQAAFRAGDAAAMVAAVTPAMVDALAVAGTPDEVRAGLARFDGLVDEVVLSPPSFRVPPERIAENLMLLATRTAA